MKKLDKTQQCQNFTQQSTQISVCSVQLMLYEVHKPSTFSSATTFCFTERTKLTNGKREYWCAGKEKCIA